MNVKQCKLMSLPRIGDERGLLSIVEGNKHVPFDIKRIFYLYDIPAHKSRGAHAHKKLHQFIIPLGGGLEVEIDDGEQKQRHYLNDPAQGLYLPPLIWTCVENFHPSSICLVLASDQYDEADYLRDYTEYLRVVGKNSGHPEA